LRWLESTNTANSKLRSSLSDANNTAGTLRAILVWKIVIGDPTRVSEGIADTLGARRYNTRIAIRTLPSVGCETGHDVGATTGLTPKGRRYTGTVLTGV
jgi:hypothetical protein